MRFFLLVLIGASLTALTVDLGSRHAMLVAHILDSRLHILLFLIRLLVFQSSAFLLLPFPDTKTSPLHFQQPFLSQPT